MSVPPARGPGGPGPAPRPASPRLPHASPRPAPAEALGGDSAPLAGATLRSLTGEGGAAAARGPPDEPSWPGASAAPGPAPGGAAPAPAAERSGVWGALVALPDAPAPPEGAEWARDSLADATFEAETVGLLCRALQGSLLATRTLHAVLGGPEIQLMAPQHRRLAASFLAAGVLRHRLDQFCGAVLSPAPGAPWRPEPAAVGLASAAREALAAADGAVASLTARWAARRRARGPAGYPLPGAPAPGACLPPVTLLELELGTRHVRAELRQLARLCLVPRDELRASRVLERTLSAARQAAPELGPLLAPAVAACLRPHLAALGRWLFSPDDLTGLPGTLAAPAGGPGGEGGPSPPGEGGPSLPGDVARAARFWASRPGLRGAGALPEMPPALLGAAGAEECLLAGVQLRLVSQAPGAEELAARLEDAREAVLRRLDREVRLVEGEALPGGLGEGPGAGGDAGRSLPLARSRAAVRAAEAAAGELERRARAEVDAFFAARDGERRLEDERRRRAAEARRGLLAAASAEKESRRQSSLRAERDRKRGAILEQERAIAGRADERRRRRAADLARDRQDLLDAARRERDEELARAVRALGDAEEAMTGERPSAERAAWKLARRRLTPLREARLAEIDRKSVV